MGEQLFGRIAHPTDLSTECEFAYHHALRLAVAAESQLDVLHVDKDAHVRRDEDFPSARKILADWGTTNGQLGRVRTIAAYGREPIHPLLSYIDENLPDLIVLATHRRHGLDRLLHKEIASKLARTGRLPTPLRPLRRGGLRIAVDGSGAPASRGLTDRLAAPAPGRGRPGGGHGARLELRGGRLHPAARR